MNAFLKYLKVQFKEMINMLNKGDYEDVKFILKTHVETIEEMEKDEM